MVDGDKPVVTITGISGYIGAETCLQFLKDGGFKVRGTVRDKTNEAKLAPLREAFGDLFDQLELVEADLLQEDSLIAAVAGSTYMVHVASPFFMSDDPEQLITPAVNGTLAAMKACHAARVKRCVITSSIASVSAVAKADRPAGRIYDESHWTNPDRPEGCGNYVKSKVLAEKAAWDFVAGLPDGEKFEIATICPGFVMGPPLRKENFTSGGWVKKLMSGEMTEIANDTCPIVDVRDVGFAHLQAVKVPEAAGRRFILAHSTPCFMEYAMPIAIKYKKLGWPISTTEKPAPAEWYQSLFDTTPSRDILGVQYRDVFTMMTEMADKMVEQGVITKP